MADRKLSQLLKGLRASCPVHQDVEISLVTADSRQVQPGALFVAIAGLQVDGRQFIPGAMAAGASALVVQEGCELVDEINVPVVYVANSRQALGQIVANFHGCPAEKMTMVAITGTNGKTTCCYLLEAIIRQAGGEPGVIGTVNYRYAGRQLPASHTTPDPEALQPILADMAAEGVTHVIMEVSSHSLVQDRVAGIFFDVALFTNLSRDHLDFHGDMERYFAAKLCLFSHHLRGKAVVVDDGSRWASQLIVSLDRYISQEDVLICGGDGADVSGHIEEMNLSGMTVAVQLASEKIVFTSPLVGEFNLRNILAVLGVGHALDLPLRELVAALSKAVGAPGRLERVVAPGVGKGPAVFVDYAHTPDALANVLRTLRSLCSGQLIVLFGCGGERDQGKRAIMGRIAGEDADYAVLTSDNPRGEDPEQILAEIEEGLRQIRQDGYVVIESRHQAIAHAIAEAGKEDVVLIAGKGHEEYQHTRTGKAFFDDRQEARLQLMS